ncbi:hypothetical protein JB92DRAFT_2894828 [Gautieria morchelliformis]|nr:hypothetical protein JB92DRAFT_2894828 [Gautieria morchelliformis]
MDPQYLRKKLSDNIQLNPAIRDVIAHELQSSFVWQKHAYEKVPRRLTLDSMRIEWERALVEGHPTHLVTSNIPRIYHY